MKSKFDDFAEPRLSDFKEGTVSWVIQRMIEDIASQASMKQLGVTHLYGLRALQRMPIGVRKAHAIRRQDVIEFIKWRRKKVGAATANQTLSMLRGALKHASATWEECENLGDVVVAIGAAMPYLQKHGLVSKSKPRTRRPTDEEITALLNYYMEPKRAKRSKIRMPEVIAFALVSTRRISEICRITWGDVDFDTATYWVRDLKHPTKKKGNDKRFVLWPELVTIIKRQPRTTFDPNARIFPFNSRSCSASYCEAKKKLGIVDLRFHDNRGEAISRWLLKGLPVEDVRLGISGHDSDRMIEQRYDRRDSADIVKHKYAHLLQPAPDQ